MTNTYPFSQPKRTTVINNESCYRDNETKEIRNADLCSFYDFDHSFMCQLPEAQLKFSRDRGTPLICDNGKLVGILSVIIPANMNNSINICTRTLRTNAYYTKISTYEKWIHSIIAVNSPPYTANGKPVPLVPLSPPFQSIVLGTFFTNRSEKFPNIKPFILHFSDTIPDRTVLGRNSVSVIGSFPAMTLISTITFVNFHNFK